MAAPELCILVRDFTLRIEGSKEDYLQRTLGLSDASLLALAGIDNNDRAEAESFTGLEQRARTKLVLQKRFSALSIETLPPPVRDLYSQASQLDDDIGLTLLTPVRPSATRLGVVFSCTGTQLVVSGKWGGPESQVQAAPSTQHC